MTVHYRTQGVVFKKNDRLEADRVFSVFTKDYGRVEVSGRAIRKITSKLKSNIDVFSLSEIEFIQGKNKKTLTDAVLVRRFNPAEAVVEKLGFAHKIACLVDNFIRGEEKDEEVFELFSNVLNGLDASKAAPPHHQFLYWYFLWNFVSLLGYAPELSKCAVCSKKLNPYQLYFSNQEGGVVCRSCSLARAGNVKITSDVVKAVRLMLQKDQSTLFKLKIAPATSAAISQISENYSRYLIHSHSLRENIREN